MNLLSLMRQFTIRTRMIGAIGVVMCLLALLGGVGLFGMLRMQSIGDEFSSRSMGQAIGVGELRAAMGDLRRHEKDMIINYEKPEQVAKLRDQWRATITRINGQLDKLSGNADGAEVELLRKMKPQVEAYAKASEPVVKQLEASGYDSATVANRMMERAKGEIQAAENALVELQKLLAASAQAAQDSSHRAAQQTLWMFGAALALAVVIVVPTTLANMVSICRPLDAARAMAERIATGDLNATADASGRDEPAKLLAALEAMRSSLRGIVSQVRQSADSIQTASTEVASGNADLSRRTEQTASSLQQTASSMEQLTGTVRHSADSAATANQLATAAAQAAHRGGQVVEQVVANMNEIQSSSKRIADIIGTIDGIAFQTNILALNAAVEAARAGEQGRGFAVVAGEVRSLAQRSAEAAREIKSLIGASVERVESGSKLVQDAGSTMTEIVSGVQRVTDIIGEITAASGEQSSGIGQINSAVTQLDHMTQQNAALVEQSAAAAESLKEQAGRLSEAVSVFRLEHAV